MWTRADPDGGELKWLKRSMEVNVSVNDMIKVMSDPETHKSSDERCKEFSVAHEFNFNSRIIKSVMEGNLVVSNREGHLFLTNQNLPDDSKCVIGFSVDTDKIKFTEGHVEAKFLIMVFHVEEISDDRCRCTAITYMSPGGSIPTTFINAMLGARHTKFLNFKKLQKVHNLFKIEFNWYMRFEINWTNDNLFLI